MNTPERTAAHAAPLLQAEGLRVAFGASEVVCGVDLSLRPGEKLALVGESGSGKTLSALAMLGLCGEASVSGSVRLDGRELLGLPARDWQRLRGRELAMVFQEPMTALNPVYTVGDQIAEVLQWHHGQSRAQAWDGAVEALAATGLDEPTRRAQAYPHQLSGGQRQRAVIAMALAGRPRVLLADEPTTALDASLRLQMLDLIEQARARDGMAVLLITHDLNLVRHFADRVAVMERGHVVEQGAVAQVFAQPQHAYTRRLLDSRPVRALDPVADEQAEPRLRAEAVRLSYPTPLPGLRGWLRKGEHVAVDGLACQIGPGQTLGVIGESGSGKSSLALAVLGLLPHRGRIEVLGQTWPQGAAARALRKRVQVVFQDPFSSLSPRLTVEQIVGEGLLVHAPAMDAQARRQRIAQALREVGLVAEGDAGDAQVAAQLPRYPHEFSGGQRQRLALARALVLDPDLLVLDEPTSALDVTVQRQILQLLQRLQRERGLSYLLITHDIDVVWAMAHQVLVLRDGRVVERGATEQVLRQPRDAYTETLMQASWGDQGPAHPAAATIQPNLS